MIVKYDKHSWPQFSIGARRTRLYWFGQTWDAAWAEIFCERNPMSIMGHIWWLSFCVDEHVDRYQIILGVGPWTRPGTRTFRLPRRRKGVRSKMMVKYRDLVKEYKGWIDTIKEDQARWQQLKVGPESAEAADNFGTRAERAEELSYLGKLIAGSHTALAACIRWEYSSVPLRIVREAGIARFWREAGLEPPDGLEKVKEMKGAR